MTFKQTNMSSCGRNYIVLGFFDFNCPNPQSPTQYLRDVRSTCCSPVGCCYPTYLPLSSPVALSFGRSLSKTQENLETFQIYTQPRLS